MNEEREKIPLIVVAGATASGKTRLAIDIAKAAGGEIVSADSMQIYKYMDIGTAKPTAAEREECVHHLIDFVEPDADFSVADYTELAHKAIADISARGGLPVMCGGTGLYINSVVNDITFGEEQTDPALREELNGLAGREGGEYMLAMLRKFDPVSAERLHPNNLRRIVRAIEFYKASGIPISEHQEQTKRMPSRYAPIMFMMFEEGLYGEVKKLRDMGYKRELNSMQGIGYKELMAHFDGELTLTEARDAIKQNSRRYAKRQLTWFRRDERIISLDPVSAAAQAVSMLKK